jgi:hypothetical protein
MSAFLFADDCDTPAAAASDIGPGDTGNGGAPIARAFGSGGFRGVLPSATAAQLAFGASSGAGASRFGNRAAAPVQGDSSALALTLLAGLLIWGALRDG